MMIDETANIDPKRLVFPGLAGLYRSLAPLSYAFMRIALGLVFLPVGTRKVFFGDAARIAAGNVLLVGVEPPLVWAWIVAFTELLGAIFLILGLFTRLAAFALAIETATIAWFITSPRGWLWTVNGAEVAVLLMLTAIGILLGGGGRYSLDRKIGREF